jgi:hypothetical protein
MRVPIPHTALFGLLLLTGMLLPPAAQADDPMIAIRLIDDQSAVYAVGEIERIVFEGDVEDPEDAAKLIQAIHLFQNQPNPFSPETKIAFELPQGGEVELAIFGPDGRMVRTLVVGERAAGRHTVRWDGLNDVGRKASSGVYFYSLRAPGIEESRQMILLP